MVETANLSRLKCPSSCHEVATGSWRQCSPVADKAMDDRTRDAFSNRTDIADMATPETRKPEMAR